MRFALAIVLGVLIPAGAAAGLPPAPRLTILKAAVDRRAQTVDLRLRICFGSGPRAAIVVGEQRSLRGVRKASRRWIPRGVEPVRIHPFSCRTGRRLNWLLEPGLRGPGTYEASVRIRDAYGRWTPRVTFAVTSP